MLIRILMSDGSPLGVSSKTVYGDNWRLGVGGSEIAIITLAEEWTKAGYEIIMYNNPNEPNASPFEQRAIADFDPKEKTDVLIIFRTPSWKAVESNALKVWFSCDQYTSVPFKNYDQIVDKIVCISPFHQKFFKDTYGIDNVEVIDLPVRLDDYKDKHVDKIPKRLIFTSIPDRGLDNLLRQWKVIVRDNPDASLVITSDYRLWGVAKRNERYILKWIKERNVEFLSALPREQLIIEQLKASIFLYPSNYDELFCIACSEAQVAGAYPITSSTGALPTTNMGKVLQIDANDPRIDRHVISVTNELLEKQDLLTKLQCEIMEKAKERFAPERILAEWDKRVFNDVKDDEDDAPKEDKMHIS